MMERLHQYLLLMRLHRPIGILLLLWPALSALWIAGQSKPDPLVLFVFVCGVILIRSAGCVINDYADRNIDGQVQRTKDRPLVTGRVSTREALLLFVVLCLAAFALVLLLNTLTIALSVVAVLLAASYPFAKRYTHFPQAHLGAAFGWAVPMAFAAQTGSVPLVAWLLFAATLLWALVYDTMYAMVDRADDLRIGVKSTAILFGNADRQIVALLQLAVLLLLLGVGWLTQLGTYYYASLFAALLFSIYQQYLIRQRNNANCLRAFLNNNWFGLVIFCGIFVDYLARN